MKRRPSESEPWPNALQLIRARVARPHVRQRPARIAEDAETRRVVRLRVERGDVPPPDLAPLVERLLAADERNPR